MAARGDAQNPSRTRVLLPTATRHALPLRQHLRAVRQLRHHHRVHPRTPSPARRHHRTTRRRRRTRVGHRSRPPRPRDHQHPEPPQPTHPTIKDRHHLVTPSPDGRLIERWFGFLTDQLLRRSVHKSVAALEKDVRGWIENWTQDPKPFVWTKTAAEILDSLGQIYSEDFRRNTPVRLRL